MTKTKNILYKLPTTANRWPLATHCKYMPFRGICTGRARNTLMIWCRFQKNNTISYGIVEADYVTAVDGGPFAEHRPTASKYRLNEVKLLVPVVPPTFYAIGSNYRNHVEGRARIKGTAPKFYDTPRVGYRANSALIATNETIVKPNDAGEHFEYEAELVAVIGRKARN